MKLEDKKIKIAVFVGQATYLGGVGIAAVNEVRELRKLGIEAELVVIFRKKDFNSLKIFDAKDIPVIFLSDKIPWILRLNFKIPGFSFFSFFHLSSVFWAPFVIGKYDVILAHETYNCFSAIACAKKSKARLVSFIWDPVSYIIPRIYGSKIPKIIFPLCLKIARLIDQYILKQSDLVLLGSNLHQKLIKNIYPSVKTQISLVGTKIMLKILLKKPKKIICLTKWERGKNPEFLLEVASSISGDFKMIIAGNWIDNSYKNEIENKIEKMGLSKKVSLAGMVSEEEKMALFSRSRVLVHPIVEAFGMFALEAAGCGCPVIMPKNSGVAELFEEGKQGFFPKEGDLKMFVEKINLLLKNEELSVKMGKEAYLVAKKYSWENHAKQIKKSLESL